MTGQTLPAGQKRELPGLPFTAERRCGQPQQTPQQQSGNTFPQPHSAYAGRVLLEQRELAWDWHEAAVEGCAAVG